MRVKFESPPINELIMGVYFDPPLLDMRSEHIGLFWSTIKENFPKSANQVPFNNVELIGPDEPFPMPRFWFISKDETFLIQIQKNAFVLNWRNRGNDQYPHFDNVKEMFYEYFNRFSVFLAEVLQVPVINLGMAELSYINIIDEKSGYTQPSDISKVIPSACNFDTGLSGLKDSHFRHIYQLSPNLFLNLAAQNKIKVGEGLENVLYYELRANGPIVVETEAELREWFEAAHSLIGDVFLKTIDENLQKLWKPKS